MIGCLYAKLKLYNDTKNLFFFPSIHAYFIYACQFSVVIFVHKVYLSFIFKYCFCYILIEENYNWMNQRKRIWIFNVIFTFDYNFMFNVCTCRVYREIDFNILLIICEICIYCKICIFMYVMLFIFRMKKSLLKKDYFTFFNKI